MNHVCADCGFSKTCSEDEFMEHIRFHDYMDEVLEEIGILPAEPAVRFTFTSVDGTKDE